MGKVRGDGGRWGGRRQETREVGREREREREATLAYHGKAPVCSAATTLMSSQMCYLSVVHCGKFQ